MDACRIDLLLGDCLEVLQGIPDSSIDAVIADPPYGTTACKWDSVIPLAPMWAELRRVAKPDAAIVLFAAQPFTSALVMSNPQEFRYEWIWRKSQGTNPHNAKHQPLKDHEGVLVFGTRRPRYFPQMTNGKPYAGFASTNGAQLGESYKGRHSRHAANTGTRYPRSVQSFAQQRQGFHPNQKPVDLLAYLVRTYTNPGDTVLDFCAGSFTTGVACLREGRQFVGIERDEAYRTIGAARMHREALALGLTEEARRCAASIAADTHEEG